jgi:DNA-binding CsgD family transcriptional regulator
MIDILNRLAGTTAEKDLDFKIIDCDTNFLSIAGMSTKDDILGLSDMDLPWAEYTSVYQAQEKDAILGNHYTIIVPSKISTGETRLFLNTKIQRTDSCGNVISIFCRAIEVINPRMNELISFLEKGPSFFSSPYCVGKSYQQLHLSPRQLEILFYLARGKSAKMIAYITRLSVRTVEHYIEDVKLKCGCRTKAELINFALMNGIATVLPEDNIENMLKKMKVC